MLSLYQSKETDVLLLIMKIDPIPDIAIDPIPYPEWPDFDNDNTRTSPRRHLGGVLKIVVPILIFLALLNAENIANVYAVVSYSGDTRVAILADSAGMNLKGKALFLSQSPELVSADELQTHCPLAGAGLVEYGCYLPSRNKIYILGIASPPYSEAMTVTAAHEMLHAAWAELGTGARNDISSVLQGYIQQVADGDARTIKDSLARYDANEAVQINELHSFVGSEVGSGVGDELEAHYRRYFSDRTKSSSANTRATQGEEEIRNDLEARRSELSERLADINDYEAKWLAPFRAAMQQNLYYGSYYTYNKNVEGYNKNLEMYNQKVDEYERRRRLFNEDIDKYNAAMAAMMPGSELNGIDSAAEKQSVQ